MGIRRIVRAVFLGIVLSGGSILGVPMRPEEIEELMSCMNKPNAELTVDEERIEDELIRQILRQIR